MTFKLVRCKRKSIGVSVTADNKITVRCPYGVSDRVIKDFLKSREAWINNIVGRNECRLAENASLINYNEIFVEGVKLPLIFSVSDKITPNAVYVRSVKNLKMLFIDCLSGKFVFYAEQLAKVLNLKPSGISFRRYKSRWGCCDGNKKITFNFILLMLPPELQRYVIVHELCHTVHMNHSKKYWELVAEIEPDYLAERKRLKNFDFLISLY